MEFLPKNACRRAFKVTGCSARSQSAATSCKKRSGGAHRHVCHQRHLGSTARERSAPPTRAWPCATSTCRVVVRLHPRQSIFSTILSCSGPSSSASSRQRGLHHPGDTLKLSKLLNDNRNKSDAELLMLCRLRLILCGARGTACISY
jgi:hypothetical protein